MLGFLIGLMIGGFVGIIMMAAMYLAAREDDRMERNNSNRE